jgi:hypothetical protein
MKKTNKILWVPVIAFALTVLSCSKSNSPAPLSPADGQAAISSASTDVTTALSGFNSAPGAVAFTSFQTINLTGTPFGRIKSINFQKQGEIKAMVTNGILAMRNMLLNATSGSKEARTQSSVQFDFASKVGVYTYNFDTQQFSKTATSDIIKIDYPKDANSSTNDAELQITAYTDTNTGTPNNPDYSPTLIHAAIYIPIGGTKEAGLDFTATYDDSGSANSATISYFVNPYTLTLSFDNTKSASASESFNLSNAGKTVIGMGLTATWASSTAKSSGQDPTALSGYVQLGKVKFDGTVDTQVQNPQSPNDVIKISVSSDGASVGQVKWIQDPNTGEWVPYIVYNDGNTKDKLEDKFADLITALQNYGII